MMRALGDITEHCAQPGAGGRTPSDFPLARLGQPAVDRLAGTGRHIDDIWPLTPLQAGMLFHSLLDTDTDPYLDQARLLLDGVSDPHALGQAWQRTVATARRCCAPCGLGRRQRAGPGDPQAGHRADHPP